MNEDSNICNCFDNFLDKYQIHSGKISIFLSVLGAVSAILVSESILAGSIAIGITNASLFFSGIVQEKIINKKRIIENENLSLKQEVSRRKTFIENFKFCPSGNPTTKSDNIDVDSNLITPIYNTPINNLAFHCEPIFQIPESYELKVPESYEVDMTSIN